jgi:hypothetical protein
LEHFTGKASMRQAMRDQLRYGALAIGAVLIAAPGVHVFERWMDHATAFWVSHGLALGCLTVVGWRWWATRGHRAPSDGSAA